MNYSDIISNAKEELKSYIVEALKDTNGETEHIEDILNSDSRVHEIADSYTPIYYSDIRALVEEADEGLDYSVDNFGGDILEWAVKEGGLMKLLQVGICSKLEHDLYEALSELTEEAAEEYEEENN